MYAPKLSNPAKRFTNRLLQFRRAVQDTGHYTIPHEVKEDLRWFQAFFPDYNRRAIIRSRVTTSQFLYTDACLTGGGAHLQDHSFFAITWPQHMTQWQVAITELELYKILLAVRVWLTQLSGTTLQIWCDNEAAVVTVRSGRTRNPFLASCIRELWYLCATADVDILISRIPGERNNTADLLSRAATSAKAQMDFQQFKAESDLHQSHIPSVLLFPPDSMTQG